MSYYATGHPFGIGGFLPQRSKRTTWESVPIKKATKDEQLPLVELVQEILALKKESPKADTAPLEAQIDELVFELYGLTAEERKIVLQA